MEIIKTNKLTKVYDVYEPYSKGEKRPFNVFSKKKRAVNALVDLDLSVQRGDIMGYIGMNGSGKSTTIKLLSGIIKPTNGNVNILGLDPFENKKKIASKMSVIFGQRSQLWWDLPVVKSYELLKSIYQIDNHTYNKNIALFVELLEMEEIIKTPVKSLSLGQRMRAEFAAAFLHNPEIVFLDEPTIGLDVIAKEKIRKFLKSINQENKVTILMSSHDLMDIEELCNNVSLINKGEKLYEGKLTDLVSKYDKQRNITLECLSSNITPASFEGLDLVNCNNNFITYSFKRENHEVSKIVKSLLETYQVKDFHLNRPSLENIVKKIHEKGEID